MQLTYNDKDYEIVIEKKRTNRNTYIRVKNDLKIHVTTTLFTPKWSIDKLIRANYDKICKMIDFQEKKVKNNTGFFYLGKKYVVIYCDNEGITFENDKVYINYNYDKFSRNIPYRKLRIRKMTTRWGVCNVRTHIITLNLELIKRDICYLDYVINHEMSHLIYGDHSRSFWKLVELNMPDYKKYRDEMKEF